jgi:tetratricopeptide (TPR) repeat protein
MVEAGRPLAAAAVLRRAVELRALQGSPERSATSIYNLARSLADANRLPKALAAYQQAEAGYLRAGAEKEALEIAVERLALVARMGDAEALEGDARGLLGRLDGAGDDAGELLASYWYELGRGRQSLGRAELALEAYTTSLALWRRLDRKLEMGQLLYSMASPHLSLLRFAEAHSLLVSSLAVAAELGDASSILAIREQLAELETLLLGRGEAVPTIPGELRPWLERGAAGSE